MYSSVTIGCVMLCHVTAYGLVPRPHPASRHLQYGEYMKWPTFSKLKDNVTCVVRATTRLTLGGCDSYPLLARYVR